MCKRLALIVIAVLGSLLGQITPAAGDDPIRLVITQMDATRFPEVHLVLRVSDAAGKPVKGLGTGDVEVLEQGQRQQAQLDLATDVAPINLVLALDLSGSMTGQALVDAKASIISMIGSLGPQDRAALVTFDSIARVAQPLTTDKGVLTAATQRASAGGNTAIYDAVALSLDVLAQRPATERRAVVLLTDGADTASSLDRDTVAARAGGLGVPIFAVGFGNAIDRPTLDALATRSANGRAYVAPNATELRAIYAGLVELVRTEYTIVYRSTAQQAPDGASIDLTLRLRIGGQVAAETSTVYRVPNGRGIFTPSTPAPLARSAPAPTTLPMLAFVSPGLIGVLGAASAGVLLFAILGLARRMPGRQRRRLETFVRGLALTAPEHAKRRSIVQRLLVPGFRTMGRSFLRITPAALLESSRRRLQHAGEPIGLGPVELIGLQFGVGLAGAILGLLIVGFTRPGGSATLEVIGGGALVGYFLPSLAVDAIARRRKDAIRKALPGSLDMLALSVEAGLSLDGAFAQVGHRWVTPLSEELRAVLLEFQMGRDRRQALQDMAARTGLPDVARFTTALIQADMLGVPLSRVLFEQAADMRLRRRQRAEDLARKAPVKMLFPMVVLIFPALFVVILGPAIPRLLALFELAH
ncbi:MAG: VWA domain-containing protein [Actinomycetota bacterium]|nr:VWA domain-containing protein [Actinomycetota bacterium]